MKWLVVFWNVNEERGRRLTPPFPQNNISLIHRNQPEQWAGFFFFCFFLFLWNIRRILSYSKDEIKHIFDSSKTIFWCNLLVYDFLFGFKVNQSFLIRLCHNVRIHALVGIKQITFYFWDKNIISLFLYFTISLPKGLYL